ncbi:MAG: HlyD family efflux transporter periplasmic adaptor subunit [Chloroherpetonaceae bacterium]|nr:HlyD family efflux transporter periplasmic adaptor subunit [Chloroherpetonaceae bacterium]
MSSEIDERSAMSSIEGEVFINQDSKMDRNIKKSFWSKERIALLAFSAVLSLAIIFGLIYRGSSKKKVERSKLLISEVKVGQFQEFIPLSGNVFPKTTFYLDLIQGGQIEKVYLEQGAQVKQGDLILKLSNAAFLLDATTRESQIFEQMSNLRNTRILMEQNTIARRGECIQIEAQLTEQKSAFNRLLLLHRQKLVSSQEFEQAENRLNELEKRFALSQLAFKQDSLFRENQLNQIEESMQRLKLNLEAVKSSVENLMVRAAMPGILTAITDQVGKAVVSGERVGQIDSEYAFKIRAPVDEYYISRVYEGQKAVATIEGNKIMLTLSKVFPEVRNGRFEVDFQFENTPAGIRRGQSIQIRLELGEQLQAVQIERGDFYQKTGGQWIYALSNDERTAKKRVIKIGRQNPDDFEILSGLSGGEKVVVAGYELCEDADELILND